MEERERRWTVGDRGSEDPRHGQKTRVTLAPVTASRMK